MKQILLIFDLNGTILYRLKKGQQRKLVSSNPHKPANHDFTITAGVKVFVRPYFKELMETLAKLPHISIAVWTSARRDNAVLLTTTLFTKTKLEFILDRSHCENAPMNIKSSNVIKNLNVIFRDKVLGLKWNELNTILIDDTKEKAKKQPLNLLQVSSFDLADHGFNASQDNVLLNLSNWIESLPLDVSDIRNYIANYHQISN
jgi:hypothetical protein